MHPETIKKKTGIVLAKIERSPTAKNFYLAGGTALAWQLGHRQSIDLDWFSRQKFSNRLIKEGLAKLGDFRLDSEEDGTIHGSLDKVRISFLFYNYKLLFPLVKSGKVNLADERDIAAMKIDAISSRGSKKDFIDLFFLLEKYSLAELLDFFEKKYQSIKYNQLHILKSLTYFEDADSEPMPIMLKKITWQQVKKQINREVKGLV